VDLAPRQTLPSPLALRKIRAQPERRERLSDSGS